MTKAFVGLHRINNSCSATSSTHPQRLLSPSFVPKTATKNLLLFPFEGSRTSSLESLHDILLLREGNLQLSLTTLSPTAVQSASHRVYLGLEVFCGT